MAYKIIQVPQAGDKISIQAGVLQVPDNPVIPFIEGDGTGRDIWRASARPEYERLQLRTDGHSPPRFRVAGVIANMPEFARAFSCKAGPVLSEAERANIW